VRDEDARGAIFFISCPFKNQKRNLNAAKLGFFKNNLLAQKLHKTFVVF
jgi:hypothetical protein